MEPYNPVTPLLGAPFSSSWPRTYHEPPSPHCQQVVFPHHPQNPLVAHLHSSSAQLRSDPSIPIAAAMFQSNLLNRRTHSHLFAIASSMLDVLPVWAGDHRALAQEFRRVYVNGLLVDRLV